MILLDSDVLSHLQKADPVGALISERLAAYPDKDLRITTVNVYEMLEGAFDKIRALQKQKKSLVPGLQLFQSLIDYISAWGDRILPYDERADVFYRALPTRLRQELHGDARIAAIAQVHHAAVWTCNVTDYQRVPGLVVYAAETGIRVA